jgi:IclR family acetate operon transcriptional repressor
MSVKSSSTVFRALRRLAGETQPVSAAELAATLAVPVTTAARALATLEAAGYAERHQGSPRFVVGKSARTLAFAFMAQFPVRDLAMPYLQQLTLEAGLTSSLFVRLGWFAVRIGRILGPSVLIHQTSLGESVRLTAGAPSLAILASMPEDEFNRALDSSGSSGDPGLRETCRAVHVSGLSIGPSLVEAGAFDVAVPLLDRRARAIASVAVEGAPSGSLAEWRDAESVGRRVMRDLAAKISREEAVELAHYDHIDPERIAF